MKLRSTPVMLAMVTISFMTGCSSRTPVYLDTGFKPAKNQQLMILHCVDARKDKISEKINEGELDKLINGWRVGISFKGLGYRLISDNRPITEMPSAELIADMNDNEIVTLAPKEAELAYLFILDDLVVDFLVIYKSVKAQGHAYIIDTRAGKVVWKDRGVDSSERSGPLMPMSIVRKDTLENCIRSMSNSIPKCADK